MKYKYNQTKKQSNKRDWIVIVLLYSCIALMIIAVHFALRCYILNGEIIRLKG